MPGWLISMLISFALKFGLPYVLDWLHKRFPWLPVTEPVKAAISDLVNKLKDGNGQKAIAIQEAKQKLNSCWAGGTGCPSNTM